ncbi:MAG TPA: thioesterase family protein [Cytophagales bacterium]|nr:thioesterase family protein [Cytophagales bacterium]
MLYNETKVRVRYAETDQMAYVYYGNYATYYEVGRVELIRSLGLSYKIMEESGVMMPVLENWSKFLKPAKYDDLLTIKVTVKEKPTARIKFDYEIFNELGILLNIGFTALVFVDSKTLKPCSPPEIMTKITDRFFE